MDGSNVVLWIGLIAFAGAILYSIFGQKPKDFGTPVVESRTRPRPEDLRPPATLDPNYQVINEIRNLVKIINEKYQQQHAFNNGAVSEIDKLKKEFEILQVRQHTLEKRIITNERTVNLVFRGPVPVEVTPTSKQKRGRGRSALIPEA